MERPEGAVPPRSRLSLTDPVCGLAVDPRTAYACEEHDGRTLCFDKRACHDEFLARPHRYGHYHDPDDPRPALDEVTGP